MIYECLVIQILDCQVGGIWWRLVLNFVDNSGKQAYMYRTFTIDIVMWWCVGDIGTDAIKADGLHCFFWTLIKTTPINHHTTRNSVWKNKLISIYPK